MKLSAIFLPLAFANPIAAIDDTHNSIVTSADQWVHTDAIHKRDAGKIEKAYEEDDVNKMLKEIRRTTEWNATVVDLKLHLLNDTFAGAMSTYADVATMNKDKGITNLDFFMSIWSKMYHVFFDNNNTDHEHKIKRLVRTIDSASILMLMTPNYYSIQKGHYEEARKYLEKRFNEPNKKDEMYIRKLSQILKKKHYDFIEDIVNDQKRSYVTFMLNTYYEYGQVWDAPPGHDQKKRIKGWGAIIDVEERDDRESKSVAVAATAGAWVSLFGLGYSAAVIYATTPVVASVPISEEGIKSKLKEDSKATLKESTTISPSTSTTPTSSTSTSTSSTSTAPTCKTTFTEDPDVASLDDNPDFFEKRDYDDFIPVETGSPDLVSRDDKNKYEPRKLRDYCKGAKDVESCTNAIKRHSVELDTEKWQYKGNKDEYYQFAQVGPKAYKTTTDALPVYVVNAMGQSAGVACNALKFVSQNYANTKYFSGFTSEEKAKQNSGEGMLALVRGKRWSKRSDLKGSRNCKDAGGETWAELNTGGKLNGDKFELDEFPPFSANLVADKNDIVFTCVPDYDNRWDGACLNRFYTKATRKGNLEDFWNSRCPNVYPPLSTYADFSHLWPNDEDSAKRAEVEEMELAAYDKQMEAAEHNSFSGSAFMVVINTKDFEGNNIDCNKYEYGSAFEEK